MIPPLAYLGAICAVVGAGTYALLCTVDPLNDSPGNATRGRAVRLPCSGNDEAAQIALGGGATENPGCIRPDATDYEINLFHKRENNRDGF